MAVGLLCSSECFVEEWERVAQCFELVSSAVGTTEGEPALVVLQNQAAVVEASHTEDMPLDAGARLVRNEEVGDRTAVCVLQEDG